MPVITAWLDQSSDRILPVLRQRAESLGAELREVDGLLHIFAAAGELKAGAEKSGTRFTIDATETARLSGLLDAHALEMTGQALHWVAAAPSGSQGVKLHEVVVERVERLSPGYARLRLGGDFSPFAAGGLHFRLLLGPEGAPWPRRGESGIDWPGGVDAWHRPPYTIRAMDAAARWIDVDIFLHEGGRVTEWLETLRPGDEARLTGPGGRSPKAADWIGLIGDETALPVVLRGLEAAGPGAKGQAFILIGAPEDAQEIALPAGISLTWVPRSEGLGMLDLLRRLDPPAPAEGRSRSVFFAGEREEAAAAREIGKEMGFTAGEFHAAAYWTAGWVPPAEQRQSRKASRS